MVGTTEAAELLNISTRRLRCLLSQNRVHGAYKSGRGWVIPLVKGYPKIKKASRGPKSTWKTVKTPGKSFAHINRKFIGKKKTDGKYIPPISLKSKGKNIYSSRVIIPGPCVVVYDYENRMPGCKATAWIETFSLPRIVNGYSFEEITAELEQVAQNNKIS
ncbi:MAG: helix-turn-helix domain-containing protein [Cyanobacteria bacterium J06621_15]